MDLWWILRGINTLIEKECLPVSHLYSKFGFVEETHLAFFSLPSQAGTPRSMHGELDLSRSRSRESVLIFLTVLIDPQTTVLASTTSS